MADTWFIRNVADLPARAHPTLGSYIRFEPEGVRFPDIGINIHVLQPGEPNGRYHRESGQEDFLVLSGECIVIVDEVEHPLRAWDYVHCPGGTDHIFVGAGSGPCHILMIGARRPDETIHYPLSPAAARYGGSAPEATDDPDAAYGDLDNTMTPTTVPWPPA